MYTQTPSGAAMPCYSTEKERREVELFRNVERQAAYELRKKGQVQPIIWRHK